MKAKEFNNIFDIDLKEVLVLEENIKNNILYLNVATKTYRNHKCFKCNSSLYRKFGYYLCKTPIYDLPINNLTTILIVTHKQKLKCVKCSHVYKVDVKTIKLYSFRRIICLTQRLADEIIRLKNLGYDSLSISHELKLPQRAVDEIFYYAGVVWKSI